MNIDELQEKLDSIREDLRGTEEYETIEDIKWMKSNSPKFISYQRSSSRRALKNLREEYDGYKCTKCGSTKNLQFHHLTYERLYHERLTDGVTLCRTCHHLGHETKNIIFKKKEKMPVEIKNSTIENFKNNRQFIEKWLYHLKLSLMECKKDATDAADKSIAREEKETISSIKKLRQDCGLVGRVCPNKTNSDCLVPIISFCNKITSKDPAEIKAEITVALNEIEEKMQIEKPRIEKPRIEKPRIEKPRVFLGDLSEETVDVVSRRKGRIKFPNGIEIDFS